MKLVIATALALAALTTTAFAADLAMPKPAQIEPIAESTAGWGGFYLGANVGYGPGTATSTDEEFSDYYDSIDVSGLFAGGQIGYNFDVGGNFILGIEGDINWANETGSNQGADDSYEYTDKINWTGAVTGHIGYSMGTIMPYLLGGVAFANNTVGYDYPDSDEPGDSQTQTHTGYTLGVGLAAMVADKVSVFAEYRYSDYGSQTYGDVEAGTVSLTDNSIRAGVNFHF